MRLFYSCVLIALLLSRPRFRSASPTQPIDCSLACWGHAAFVSGNCRQVLNLAAGKSVQVIDLLNGQNVAVRYHGFERSSPGMKERGISAKGVRVALRRVLPSQSGNYLFVDSSLLFTRRVLRVKIPQNARLAQHHTKEMLLDFFSGILPSK